MAIDDVAVWVPDSCSLPTRERPLRASEFDGLFADSVLRTSRFSARRLDLTLAADAEAAARTLAAKEADCCSFFGFEFDTHGAQVVMQITVPDSHTDVLDALAARVAATAAGIGPNEQV